jgi:succinoglycan biosynthesis protein ExoA
MSSLNIQTSMIPRVALLVPTLNEETHIDQILETICAQEQDLVRLVVVVDGGSTDLTRPRVEAFALRDKRVRLLDNPDRLQSAGLTSAARTLPEDINTLIRVDAHSEYPADFVARLLGAAEQTGADSVVVRMRSIGRGDFGRAVGVLSNTVFGAGNAAHRMSGQSGWVDHGHHALFRREAFEAVGGYDPSFATNEDAELDVRLQRGGYRIWFENDVVINYGPRETLRALTRQYWRYGVGRAKTVRKHRTGLKVRQLIPTLCFIVMAVCLLASSLYPLFLLIPTLYLVSCAFIGLVYGIRDRSVFMIHAVTVLPAIHMSWGAGFLYSYLFFWGGMFKYNAMERVTIQYML